MAEEEFGRKKLSRRGFLKIAVGGTAAALLPEVLERITYKGVGLGLTTPGVTDEIISSALGFSERSSGSENPNFRSIEQILGEGIKGYSDRTGDKVFYRKNPSYRDKYYYADAIEYVAKASLLPTIPKNATQQIKSKFPTDAFYAFVSSDARYGQFADLFTEGSGFLARFKESNPALFREDGGIKNGYFSTTQDSGFSEINEARKRIETEAEKGGGPVSAALVVEHFLEKSKGNLAESIYDTAIFLKFMARNDPEKGGGLSNEFNVTWMRENIKDEYQGSSYINPQKGESVINLVGKPYHSWNLVALLQFFPVEMIQVGGIYRQAVTFKEQGLGKTRSDLETLNNLRRVEDLLSQYSD